MGRNTANTGLHRRKEAVLLLCAMAACALAVAYSMTGWLDDETWGVPTVKSRGMAADTIEVAAPDFGAVWNRGGRNPFGDASETLDSGGKANIPLPPLPPLTADVPPAPMPLPIDFLQEGGQ